jgi:hypothetical protein
VNEKTVHPDNVHDPNNEPEDSEERFVATEDWVASFFEGSNEPVVLDLETDEAIPVIFPDRPTKEAHCPRCGHRKTVDPLIEAVSRIADLSSQLETGGGQQ